MADSLRLRILLSLQERFKGIEKMVGDDPDPALFDFSTVEIGALVEGDARKRTAIGLVVGDERKDQSMYPIEICTLPLSVEYRLTVQKDEKPGVMAERMLTEVQRVINKDRTVGGLCVDLTEVGNSVNVASYADKTAEGVVHYEVKYRHNLDDPRSLD